VTNKKFGRIKKFYGGEKMKNKILLVCFISVLISNLVVDIGIANKTAVAQPRPKVIQLKLAHPMPPGHFTAVDMWDWWAKELGKRTNGRVKVTSYPAGALGQAPVLWENTLKGICDIGCIGNYNPDKFPVMDFPQWLPFRIPNFAVLNHISWHLYYQGLLDPELEGYKFLYPCNPGTILLCTSKKKVMTLADFQGLRIRVIGSCPAINHLKADTLNMPLGEVFTALERGTIDGLITGPSVITSAKLDKVVKYICLAEFSYGLWYTLMNLSVWNSLPSDIKHIIDVLNQETYYRQVLPTYYQKDQVDAVKICRSAGIEFYRPVPSELDRWKGMTAGLADEWVANYEAKGLPGKKVKEEVLKVLDMYEQTYLKP
jgi:TRAP-type C4-dicarboxylate transport system substrate-binding protein